MRHNASRVRSVVGSTAYHAAHLTSPPSHKRVQTIIAKAIQTIPPCFLTPDLSSACTCPRVARVARRAAPVHRLSLGAATCRPPRYRPLVIAKRDGRSLGGHPEANRVTSQAHRLHEEVHRAIEGRAFRGAERLVASPADKALVLARVDANVAPASLSSGGARHMWSRINPCGVHALVCPSRDVFRNVPRGVGLTPIFDASETIPSG